jgi:hypothetical protein
MSAATCGSDSPMLLRLTEATLASSPRDPLAHPGYAWFVSRTWRGVRDTMKMAARPQRQGFMTGSRGIARSAFTVAWTCSGLGRRTSRDRGLRKLSQARAGAERGVRILRRCA